MADNNLTYPNCNTTVKTYRNPFPTVDIIVRQGKQIVFIERKNEPFGWTLPGGFADYGERLEQAALREAREETALELKNLQQFQAHSDPKRDPRQHNMSMVFTAAAAAAGLLCGGDDAAQAKLFSLDALPKLCFDHAKILEDYRNNLAGID